MKIGLMIAALICFAAGPATEPTTKPLLPRLRDNAPQALKDFCTEAQRKADAEIASANATLRMMENGKIDGKQQSDVRLVRSKETYYSFKTQADKDRYVRARHTQIDSLLQQRQRPWEKFKADDIIRDWTIGLVGRIRLEVVKQVIDRDNAIVTAYLMDAAGNQDGTSLHTIWLNGFDTTKSEDGSRIDQEAEVFLVGNRSYQSASGAQRTIIQATTFDIEQYLDR